MGGTGSDNGSESAVRGNTVSFTLLSLPGSINTIYEYGYTIFSARPMRRLKPEWSLWKTRAAPFVPMFKAATNSIIRVDRCYYYPWFTSRNKKWRHVDTANMDKMLMDLIADRIGINDLYFKCGWMDSRDSPENKVVVTLTEITEAEWKNNNHNQ